MSGSSPLTRGKRQGVVGTIASDGLIPAHAGKTPSMTRTAAPRTAHPRSRGENRDRVGTGRYETGSSPLTRGKLIADTHGLTEIRLIPAHAGKTAPCSHLTSRWEAHPRSRGEN